MSLNAATIEYLLSKGLTGEDLLAVAQRMEKRADNTATQRKRRQRAREKESHAVTVTRDTVSPNEDIILTPSVPSTVSNETAVPVLKPEHVVEVWNEQAPAWGLKSIRKFTPQRRRKLLTRIRENTIDEFTEAISAIGRSPFLRGENGRGWRADFDWMLEPKNFTKLLEGTYDR